MQPWPWYVAGPMIAATMFVLLFMGKSFGISSTLQTVCAATGAGKKIPFFDFDWKTGRWNLFFALGLLIGSFIAFEFMGINKEIEVAPATRDWLLSIGLKDTKGYLPADIFSWSEVLTFKGMTLLGLGGFLIGFGARYAGGCTSGHAISGLSNLQFPSLLAVIGFFAGGLVMTYWLLPLILAL